MTDTSPERIAELRRMPPEAKLREAERLWWKAREERVTSLRKTHPDWTEESVRAEVRRAMLNEAMKEG